MGVPGGGTPETIPWFSADLTGLNIAIHSGGVYVGARYVAPDPWVYLTSDETPSTPQQRGWFRADDEPWDELGIPDYFPGYRAMFIRPRMPSTGCQLPESIPWLNVSPPSGITAAGDSSFIEVTANAAGMSTGVYGALVCINSNDPHQPIIEVSYTLTVSTDVIFEDHLKQ